MKLSIVTTLYRSAPYIAEFIQRSTQAAALFSGDAYEIVFVNDGSPDNSLDLIVEAAEKNPHIVVVDLSRNFGHHKAMMTGLMQAKGEYIYLLDSDLEEEPEWLDLFSKQLQNADVVYGIQEQRRGGVIDKLSGQLFYNLFCLLTSIAMPKNITTARLMTRRYVDALLRHEEREMFIAGLWEITGFEQRGILVKKHSTSETTYSFRHKMAILVNSVTSFSNAPLVGIFYIGIVIFLLATLYSLYLVTNWLFFAKPLSGWTSVMASVWLLGGLIISFIGVIGIYLSKIFSETKRRPYTIIRKVYGRDEKQ